MEVSSEEFKKALSKAMTYCSRSEKCFADVQKNLSSYDLSGAELMQLRKELESGNFLDEQRYADAFVNDKFKFNKWGKLKIYYGLKNKFISSDIIYSALDQIDSEDYFSTLESLLKSKLSTYKSKDREKVNQSLVRYAYSKGYEWEVIEKVLKITI